MVDDILMRAIAWRNGEHTGLSSIALVSHLMGWPNGGKDTPRDGGDFERCVQALNAVPELRERLNEARTISPQWNALVEHWAELEELLKRDQSANLYHRICELTLIYCRRGCGELKWEAEREAVCPVCRSRVGGLRDPRLPKPEPPKPQGVRDHLVVRFLLVDASGNLVDSQVQCDECDGEGEVECDMGCEHDCEACDGTGTVRAMATEGQTPPIAGEGEEVVVAIIDERNPKGPRLAYPSVPAAEHALTILREQSDDVLSSFFAERKAA